MNLLNILFLSFLMFLIIIGVMLMKKADENVSRELMAFGLTLAIVGAIFIVNYFL